MKELTAMQDLRNDLQETIDSAHNALMEIEDDIIRKCCQEAVRLTIVNVVRRINNELLEKEKQQIIYAADCQTEKTGMSGEQYYNETFKND